jgi:hypothetical protein
MIETSAVTRLVRNARRSATPATVRPAEPLLRVNVAIPKATVLLKRPFRDAAYIRRHVSYVVKEDAERGEWHIRRNLSIIRRKLDEMGLDPAVVDREVRDIEAAVRAELWRQVILGDGPE